ncbi:MAG TPA: dihydroorotate dehydrogenase [Chloroflexota bacterium]|nr:dihydroorotate dehydrogenase [Chloroflexota bacterium]
MHDPRLAVDLGGGLRLRNPVMPASGCFGPEMGALVDLNVLGALVTKTIFYHPRAGNPSPRLAETPAGMLNSVGIPSRGVEDFLARILPAYLRYQPPTIVSIGGLSIREYWDLAARLDGVPGVAALEVNISCPNLEAGGLEIGANPEHVAAVIHGVVRRFRGPVIAKLTPNVTRISDIALAAEEAGATAISAINTFVGMAIDVRQRRTVTGTATAGLSGPAIKPLALRMVWETARAVRVPVIGMGGISNAQDALEFILAGATAVAIGTANFARPTAMHDTIAGLSRFLDEEGIGDIRELVGAVRCDPLGAAATREHAVAELTLGEPELAGEDTVPASDAQAGSPEPR